MVNKSYSGITAAAITLFLVVVLLTLWYGMGIALAYIYVSHGLYAGIAFGLLPLVGVFVFSLYREFGIEISISERKR